MTTTQLECFVKVAETLNFLRAAEQLHISQPAVSKQIVSLENDVGAKLFVRSTHNCTLTPEGVAFLESARNILRLTYRSKQDIKSFHAGSSSLRIGYTDAHEMVRLYPSLNEMRKRDPDFSPSFYMDSWDINVNRVISREIDLCFSFQRNIKDRDDLRFFPLTHGTMICVVPKWHPLARLAQIAPEDAKNHSQVICVPDTLKNEYYSGHKQPAVLEAPGQISYVCSNASEAYTMVLSGMGYCLLPEYVIAPHPDLRFYRWPIKAEMAHGMVCLKEKLSNVLLRFIRTVEENYQGVDAA